MKYRPPDPPDLLSLLPLYFRAIKDFIAIMKTENIELEQFETYLWQVLANFFVQTCDEPTLRYHESLLRIKTLPGDTIAFRRLRILNKYNNTPPFTLPVLKERLNMLFGAGNYTLVVDYAESHVSLTVNVERYEYGVTLELISMLIFMLPAHLTFDIVQNVNQYYAVVDYHAGATSTYIQEVFTE